MPLYNIPNATTGMDTILANLSQEIPSFFPLFLLSIFLIVFIGGSFAQGRRIGGSADMPLWAVLASMSTLLVALPLTISSGTIDMTTWVVIVTVTLGSGLWFFMSKGRGEA